MGTKPCTEPRTKSSLPEFPISRRNSPLRNYCSSSSGLYRKKKECPQSSEKPGASPSLSQPQSLRGQPHFAPCMQNDLTDGVQEWLRGSCSPPAQTLKRLGGRETMPPFPLGFVLKNTFCYKNVTVKYTEFIIVILNE